MHELGIAKDLWNVIENKSRQNGFILLKKITIKVGEASGIDIDMLRHSLVEHIFPKTIAKSANLEIIQEKLLARCSNCNKYITKDELSTFVCPWCGSLNVEIISGQEVYVEKIEGQ